MESRRPRTERSALALTDLPRDPEALTDPEALALKGGRPRAWEVTPYQAFLNGRAYEASSYGWGEFMVDVAASL
jgi:hypothetical protein